MPAIDLTPFSRQYRVLKPAADCGTHSANTDPSVQFTLAVVDMIVKQPQPSATDFDSYPEEVVLLYCEGESDVS
jgi:hypothetical protein